MYCKNCGHEYGVDEKFCIKCGQPILETALVTDLQVNKQSHTHSSSALEGRPWYRALKVVYILLIVLAVLITGAISWSLKPVQTIDGEKSSIVCDSGKSYSPSKNSIYIYSWEDELGTSNDRDARILCKYDTLNFYTHQNEAIQKNYKFIVVYEEMHTDSWFGYSILAFFIVWLVSYLIKTAFLYIAVGIKPKIKP